jgi:hypothetical protein
MVKQFNRLLAMTTLHEFRLVDNPVPEEQETQKSDLNLVTLERNSYNFLE